MINENAPELAKRPANYAPLSPISFLHRAAHIFGDRIAIIEKERQFTYREFYARARRLADALQKRGIQKGDVVAIMARNTPALLEAHYAVPMLGAVLNPINVRLDARAIAFCLDHGEAKLLIAERIFENEITPALAQTQQAPYVVELASPEIDEPVSFGACEYEEFLTEGTPEFTYQLPQDEWHSLCLLYTSGTTGDPKGAIYSHRGAYLAALSNALTFQLDHRSVYLWTLPMFHCSGWTFTWAVTAAGGTHLCLHQVLPGEIFKAIEQHKVTHFCGAPIVLNMICNASAEEKRPLPHKVKCATGGAAPPSAIITAMEQDGFEVLHLYGTTETYGPSTYCAPDESWDELADSERHLMMARQGVSYPSLQDVIIAEGETITPTPKDGDTIGEIMVRGNSVMKGYLKNPATTDKAFAGGWYHSGDLAAWGEDGYIQVKDRAKDIIISGGENISSLEIEDVLYRHPAILEAAVVACPDAKWGETPCACIELKTDVPAPSEQEIREFCRENLAGFKVPKHVLFISLPKTSTGKIQKFTLRDQAIAALKSNVES